MFNQKYVQTGNVCLIASYGILIEALSENNFSISKTFSSYLKTYKIKVNYDEEKAITDFQKKSVKENKISDHYHTYCRSANDLRGTEFIRQIHNDNILETGKFAEILYTNASTSPLPSSEIDRLQNALKEGNFAIIVTNISTGNFHAVVLGYDSKDNCFILRDPNISKELKKPSLYDLIITEILVFKKSAKDEF